MMIKSYAELQALKTFEERFNYCKLPGKVGEETFGVKRWLNQVFYKSDLWRKEIRPTIIARDFGCDLGVAGYSIEGFIIVHHIVPITEDDIREHSDILTNPINLICVSKATHDAIHYGDINTASKYEFKERSPGDTCPWRTYVK